MKKIFIFTAVFGILFGNLAGAGVANAAALTDAQIQSIISLLQSFGADATTVSNVNASLHGQATSGTATTGTIPAALLSSGNLTVGSKGDAVKSLQQFLNGAGYAVSTSGTGSAGSESTFFGTKTKAALSKWQAANSISPASGYFGIKSRAALNKILLEKQTTSVVQPAETTAPVVPTATTTTIIETAATTTTATTATTTTATTASETTSSCPRDYSFRMLVDYPSKTLSAYTNIVLTEFKFTATQPAAVTKIRFKNTGTLSDYYFRDLDLISSKNSAILATSTINDQIIEFNLKPDSLKTDKGLMISDGIYHIRMTPLTPPSYKKIILDVLSSTDITAVDYNDLNCAVDVSKNNTFPITGPVMTSF